MSEDLVYFVRCKDEIKIGYSGQFSTRWGDLRRKYPGLTQIGVMPGTMSLERALHKRFHEYGAKKSAAGRLLSDWFYAHDEIVSFAKEHTYLYPLKERPLTQWAGKQRPVSVSRLTLALPRDVYEELRTVARRKGETKSDVLTTALKEYLERNR